jgi:anti-anti-sigma factor
LRVIAPDYFVDTAGAIRLEAELTGGESVDDVILDLVDVAFIASSGLRVLLKATQERRVAGSDLRVCGANATVTEIFEVSGFDKILSLYPDRQAAEEAPGVS